MKILVFGENSDRVNYLSQLIHDAEFEMIAEPDPATVPDPHLADPADLAIIDASATEDPIAAIRTLRQAKTAMPILVLANELDHRNTVQALNTGADDVADNSVDPNLLKARIAAIMRRTPVPKDRKLRVGVLVVDRMRHTASIHGRDIALTNREYEVLELFCSRKGKILSKDMIIQQLYQDVDAPGRKAIEVFVCKLRKKLSAASGGMSFIETHWGHGYVLRDPVSDVPQALSA